jgi:hypothetical protein
VSSVLVFVVIGSKLLVFVCLSLKLLIRVWTRSTIWRHFSVKGVTQHLHLTTRKWGCKIIYPHS